MRIGTWNVENLFRPGGETAGPTSEDAYQQKIASLASTIADLDPDALAVQEVGDPEALDDLVAALSGDWQSALAAPDGRGIRVGIISKTALGNVEQVTDFPPGLGSVQVDDNGQTISGIGRPGLGATLGSGGDEVTLVSVHLKSKLLTFPGGRFSTSDEGERARYAVYALHRRAAEAAGVRDYVTGLLADSERSVAVAGDLNDEPQAATNQLLLGPPGSEIGTAGFDRPDKGDAQRLWNLAALIPEGERWSRLYRGRRELIDHILVSHSLVSRVESVTTGATDVPSITDDPNARRDDPGSDHRPVLAVLEG